MARRNRSSALILEYKDLSTFIRNHAVTLNVEYKVDRPNTIQARTVVLMVEYTGTPVVSEPSKVGPSWQMMS